MATQARELFHSHYQRVWRIQTAEKSAENSPVIPWSQTLKYLALSTRIIWKFRREFRTELPSFYEEQMPKAPNSVPNPIKNPSKSIKIMKQINQNPSKSQVFRFEKTPNSVRTPSIFGAWRRKATSARLAPLERRPIAAPGGAKSHGGPTHHLGMSIASHGKFGHFNDPPAEVGS